MFGFNSDKNKNPSPTKSKINFLDNFSNEKNKSKEALTATKTPSLEIQKPPLLPLKPSPAKNSEEKKKENKNIFLFFKKSAAKPAAEIKKDEDKKNSTDSSIDKKSEVKKNSDQDVKQNIIPAKKEPDWAKELNAKKPEETAKNKKSFIANFFKKSVFLSGKKEGLTSRRNLKNPPAENKISASENKTSEENPAAVNSVEKISIKELLEKKKKMDEQEKKNPPKKKFWGGFFADPAEEQEWDEDNHDPNKPIIETRNLSVTYNLGKSNELHALKDANVKIYPGEYIIMYGPSGCGKSTLLFAIAGLQNPTKGNVIIDGVDISRLKRNSQKMVDFHRNKIGIIFQAFHLIPSLNIFKNVALPQIFSGISLKIRKGKVMKLLERFEISSQAEKLPSQLSGGQKQRVAIARALVNDPKILLADEPVGNLDSKSAETVLGILKELNERDKRTIILVTHDSRHLNFANRVFYLKDGVVIRETVNKDIRPETIQIQDTEKPQISQEMELLMRTYSGLSSSQLGGMLIPYKAKQLVQDILVGMSSEQVKVMEKAVEDFLMNINTSSDYSSISRTLDIALEKGGAGLDKRTSKNLEEKIKSVLEEVKYLIKEEAAAQEEYKTSDSSKKVQHLRKFILEKYNINVHKEEIIKRLDQALELRLKNQLDSFRLRKFLDKSFEKGGAGLDKRNAKKITKEMELMMLLKFK